MSVTVRLLVSKSCLTQSPLTPSILQVCVFEDPIIYPEALRDVCQNAKGYSAVTLMISEKIRKLKENQIVLLGSTKT